MVSNNLKVSQIKGATSLDDIAPYYLAMVKYTAGLIHSEKNKDVAIANDIVGDVILQLHKAFEKGKVIDAGYVIMALKNTYINEYNKAMRTNTGNELHEATIPEDEEDDVYNMVEFKEGIEELFENMNERINELRFYDKNILKYSQTKGLKELHRLSGISYRSLSYSLQKIRIKLGIDTKEKVRQFKKTKFFDGSYDEWERQYQKENNYILKEKPNGK